MLRLNEIGGLETDNLTPKNIKGVLATGKLERQGNTKGAYLRLFKITGNNGEKPFAVKVLMDTDKTLMDQLGRQSVSISDERRRELLGKGFVCMDEESDEDMINRFLLLVDDYDICKRYLEDFILDTLFVGFKPNESELEGNVVVKDPDDPIVVKFFTQDNLAFFRSKAEGLERIGRLSTDGREIILKAGVVAYAVYTGVDGWSMVKKSHRG